MERNRNLKKHKDYHLLGVVVVGTGRGRLSVNRIRAASTAKIFNKCAIIFD